MINHVFTKKEIAKIGGLIYQFKKEEYEKPNEVHAIRNLLAKIPDLKTCLLNNNLKKLLSAIDPQLRLTKAMYFDKFPSVLEYVVEDDSSINYYHNQPARGMCFLVQFV